MSLPGRPKGEYRSAQRVGCLMSLPGRPKGQYRCARGRFEALIPERAARRVVR